MGAFLWFANFQEWPLHFTMTTFAFAFSSFLVFIVGFSIYLYLFIELPLAKLWGVFLNDVVYKNASTVKTGKQKAK